MLFAVAEAVSIAILAAKAGYSSVGGLVGQPFNEVYCASKFAVEGYIERLAGYVSPAFGGLIIFYKVLDYR